MGFIDRLTGRQAAPTDIAPALLEGDETLEVVGESHYQDALWALAGGETGQRVRVDVVAVLSPDPTNRYDQNAIKVMVEGRHVGHLSRDDAADYLPGLLQLQQQYDRPIALRGCVVGGGRDEGRAGMLGIFLDHDPVDFGL